MFYDEAKVFVKAGNGGNGIVAFRKEKYVPRGGPAGGDGGRGGNVVFQVDPKRTTLVLFQKRSHFIADSGGKGGSSNKTGAKGDDLIVPVPPGTLVRDSESKRLLADLTEIGATYVVAQGGRGGKGNTRFKSSTNQAPRIAEKGEPGEERWLELELKLLADVAIIGVPNAGKSTLLSVISNAKPKIADYPFTTLQPNLGVVIVDDREVVVADIPGLIEGAHSGIGLGHSFLRHIQRTRLLVHLLDGMSDDVLADFNQINTEISLFDPDLEKKHQIVVLNKMDIPDVKNNHGNLEQVFEEMGVELHNISAVAHQGLNPLLFEIANVLNELPEEVVEFDIPVFTPEEEDFFEIVREEEGYFVSGDRIERAAAMTYWEYQEAVLRFHRILEALGVSEALINEGIQPGDSVFIGEYELEWFD